MAKKKRKKNCELLLRKEKWKNDYILLNEKCDAIKK